MSDGNQRVDLTRAEIEEIARQHPDNWREEVAKAANQLSHPSPDETRGVLFTDVNGEESVMVFTTLDVEEVKAIYDNDDNIEFTDCFEVLPHERQFYLFETLFLSLKDEEVARKRLA